MLGRSLLHYVIREKLGEGGMGVVYKAWDTQLDRYVAIKILPPDRSGPADSKARFIQEAKAASALNHPNIITIHQIGQQDGVDLIVMEFVEGETLDRILARGPMPEKDVLYYGIQIAGGLERAHSAGIIHRDLKPANLMVTGQRLIKILDFGLAKLNEPATSGGGEDRETQSKMVLTEAGTVMGTYAYMSPEQAQAGHVDGRSDVFALGAVLYEMISGRRAFEGSSSLAVLTAVLRDEPPPLTAAPEPLSEVVFRCLEKSPSKRYWQMLDVKLALEDLRTGQAPESGITRRSAIVEVIPSVAVLPFANLSPDKENEYFSDGLAEEIINSLANVAGLRVTARTSAFSFRGKDADIRSIAEKLNVASVLEGSVRRAGNRIRVTVQLSTAADGYQIWSERFDREMADVFDMQDEISQAIVGKLRVKLAREQPVARGRTVNVEAYQAYLRGRYHLHKFTRVDMARAREYFEQSVALDPDYALAHGGMADFYWALGGIGLLAPKQAMPLAAASARRALELDGSLADAHSVLALVSATYDYDRAKAEVEFRRALEADASSPLCRFRHAMFHLRPMGRMEEALAALRSVLDLDPLSLLYQVNYGNLLYFARRYDEAIGQFQRTIEMDANYYPAYAMLSAAQLLKGQTGDALASVQKAQSLGSENPMVSGAVAAVLAAAGQREEALALAGKMEAYAAQTYIPATSIACAYTGLGDLDRTFTWLDRAVAGRDPIVLTVAADPFYDSIRGDARYAELLRKMQPAPP